MTSIQTSSLTNLGSLLIPLLILLVIGRALRFDPNRRASRPNQVGQTLKPYDQPWNWFFIILQVGLGLLLVLILTESIIFSGQTRILEMYLPAWLFFQNAELSALYISLIFFALWLVRRLKHMSVDTLDYAFATHIDFSDWKVVDPIRDSRPAIVMGRWRYQMKWWFKTNIELIDALHLRLIFECADFATFEQRVKESDYPVSFQGDKLSRPYGFFLGTVQKLMNDAVLQGIYRSKSLWDIWRDERDPRTGAKITAIEDMSRMLYDEIRGLILCPYCRALPEQQLRCDQCGSSGAFMHHCTVCQGAGVDLAQQKCGNCVGIGLELRPTPYAFLNRMQYFWMARNVDYLSKTFPIWLSYYSYLFFFAIPTILFLGVSFLVHIPMNVDFLIVALLFGSACLVGCIGFAIVIIFGTAFNSSGTLVASYPLRFDRFGNRVWMMLMGLVSWLVFGLLLIDTTFVMSQILLETHIQFLTFYLATASLTLYIIFIGALGVQRIHAGMRDSKRSQMEEIEHWLHAVAAERRVLDISKEREFYKELREVHEWPIEGFSVLGALSGFVLPVSLTFGSIFWSYLTNLLTH